MTSPTRKGCFLSLVKTVSFFRLFFLVQFIAICASLNHDSPYTTNQATEVFNQYNRKRLWSRTVFSSSTKITESVFNTEGVFSDTNQISQRYAHSSCSFRNNNDRFWIFGGTIDQDNKCLNDLWEYSRSLKQWRFFRYSSDVEQKHGVNNYWPGSRWRHSMVCLNGLIYLYGGQGFGIDSGDIGFLNDLWRFPVDGANTETRWTLIKGLPHINPGWGELDMKINEWGTDIPRLYEMNMIPFEDRNSFVIFGGGLAGGGGDGNSYSSNAFFIHDLTRTQSIYHKGESLYPHVPPQHYEERNVYNDSNMIGQRLKSTGWKISNDELYIYGGMAFGNSVNFNDLWMYNMITHMWKLVSGGNLTTCHSIINIEDIGKSYGQGEVIETESACRSLGGTFYDEINQDIYIIGGFRNGGIKTNEVFAYSILNDTWWYVYGHGNGIGSHSNEYSESNVIGAAQQFSISSYRDNNTDFRIDIFGGSGHSDLFYNYPMSQLTELKEVKICFERYEYENDVCHGHGECVNHEECHCEDEWYGEQCKITKCGGIMSSNSTVCNSNGICNDMICYCYPGYQGNLCENTGCIGRDISSPYACSGHGQCNNISKCECENGFYGERCDLSKCDGVLSNNLTACSSSGSCVEGKCKCFSGFEGNLCESVINITPEMMLALFIVSITVGVIIIIVISILILLFACAIWRNQVKANYEKVSNLYNKFKLIFRVNRVDLEMIIAEEEGSISLGEVKKAISGTTIQLSDIKVKFDQELKGKNANVKLYLCEWNNQIVVFKKIEAQTLEKDEIKGKKFWNEYHLFMRLRHPNILMFFGIVCEKTYFGFVMEYCIHGNIKSFLQDAFKKNKRYFDFVEKLRFLCEICHALSSLHVKNFIHREISLSNVLIDMTIRTKIKGLGSSRIIKKDMTKRVGKGIYMAPEVFNGNAYGKKCDVFSFGILAHQILQESFSIEDLYGLNLSEMEIAEKVNGDPLFRPKIDKYVYHNNQKLIGVVSRCLENDAKNRHDFEKIITVLDLVKQEHTEKRIAFVVGNSDYEHMSFLPSSKNDSVEMAKTLRAFDFEVFEHHDLDYDDLCDEFDEFVIHRSELIKKFPYNEILSVIYYSGHGITQANQFVLIMPVDFNQSKVKNKHELLKKTISLKSMKLNLECTQRGKNVVILDCCRNALKFPKVPKSSPLIERKMERKKKKPIKIKKKKKSRREHARSVDMNAGLFGSLKKRDVNVVNDEKEKEFSCEVEGDKCVIALDKETEEIVVKEENCKEELSLLTFEELDKIEIKEDKDHTQVFVVPFEGEKTPLKFIRSNDAWAFKNKIEDVLKEYEEVDSDGSNNSKYESETTDEEIQKEEEQNDSIEILIPNITRGIEVWSSTESKIQSFPKSSHNYLICYSTDPGLPAFDSYKLKDQSDSDLSPYTSSLINRLYTGKNRSFESILKSVKADVNEKTKNSQTPWYESNLEEMIIWAKDL